MKQQKKFPAAGAAAVACPREYNYPIRYNRNVHLSMDEQAGYYDVYVNGNLAYMDGEVCEVVSCGPDECVTLRNKNNPKENECFTITLHHFNHVFALQK